MKFSPSAVKAKALALAAVAGASIGTAHAALPAAVTDALDGAETDLLALYAALTAVGAALFVARIIYRKFAIR